MKTLLLDDFQGLPIGPFPSEYSAIGEYHYEAQKGRLNHWYESTNWHGWRKKLTSAWMVIEDEGRHQLLQNLENDEVDNRLSLARMLVTGADEWTDYTVRVQLRILKSSGFAGMAVRYVSSRKQYQVGVSETGQLGIWKVCHDERMLLASHPFTLSTKVWYNMEVAVKGRMITVRIDGLTPRPPLLGKEGEQELLNQDPVLLPLSWEERGPGGEFFLRSEDASYDHGRVALVTCCPCLYNSVHISTDEAAYTTIRIKLRVYL